MAFSPTSNSSGPPVCYLCGSPHPSVYRNGICDYCNLHKQRPIYSSAPFSTVLPAGVRTPEPQPLPHETTTTPLIGYRVWKLDRKEGKLGSTFMKQYFWPFRKPVCKDPIDDLGIHAVKSGKVVRDGTTPRMMVFSFFVNDDPSLAALWDSYKADVAGSVYLWGEIKEHTMGYTAEFAYPKELWMPEDTDPITVMQLEHNYGVPVTLRSDLKRHFTEEDGDRIAKTLSQAAVTQMTVRYVNTATTHGSAILNTSTGQVYPTPSNPPGAIQKYSKP